RTDFERGPRQVARVPIKPNRIQGTDAFFGHRALFAFLEKEILTALMFDPDIQRAIVEIGGDGAVAICHAKGLQGLKASRPHGSVRVKDKADLQQLSLTFICEGGMMSKLLSLHLMALSFYPLCQFLVGGIGMWNKQMSVLVAKAKQFLESLLPLGSLILSELHGGWAAVAALIVATDQSRLNRKRRSWGYDVRDLRRGHGSHGREDRGGGWERSEADVASTVGAGRGRRVELELAIPFAVAGEAFVAGAGGHEIPGH
ncbi:MAG: hypothetical protein SGARI_001764, partial [Bacillariaceae sp.]